MYTGHYLDDAVWAMAQIGCLTGLSYKKQNKTIQSKKQKQKQHIKLDT
jgi:hypothetical protein